MAHPQSAPRPRFNATFAAFLTSFNLLYPNVLHQLIPLAVECMPDARFVIAGGSVLRALLLEVVCAVLCCFTLICAAPRLFALNLQFKTRCRASQPKRFEQRTDIDIFIHSLKDDQTAAQVPSSSSVITSTTQSTFHITRPC
jgi:hypothetical protein